MLNKLEAGTVSKGTLGIYEVSGMSPLPPLKGILLHNT